MTARADSPLSYGLYFIDVLACLLFSITLALAGARFDRERSARVDLPRADPVAETGSAVLGEAIVLRTRDGELELFLGEERLGFEALEARLRRDPPPVVTVRSEASALARVIAIADAAGVRDIQLAYEAADPKETTR